MLHALPDTRMIFEPFHARQGIAALRSHRYVHVPENAAEISLQSALENLMSMSSWNPWVERFNPIGQFIYRRRLIKEVRINLLLPHILHQFPEYRFVLLLRHPAAVVQSQLSGGWLLSPQRLYEQQTLMQLDWVKKLQGLDLPAQPFFRNLVFWAIENRIALDAARKSGIPIMFYENLCAKPAAQLELLETYLDVQFPDSATQDLGAASWSSNKAVSEYSLEEKISAWQTRIQNAETTGMLRVLEATGLDRIYGRDSFPQLAESR